MLFRRDLGRSGSALACNILAGRPKGTQWPSSRDAPKARQPRPPHAAQSVRAGVLWAGRGTGMHWPSPACVCTLAACCHMPAQHTRTAPGTAVPTSCTTWHRPPRTADARVCPAQACPERPAPCALRPTHLCPPSVSQRFDGAGGGGAPDVEGALIEAELARSLRWLAGPSNQAPASPGRSAARLTAAPRSLTGRIGCYPTGGPGSRPGRPLFTSVSCRRCLRVQASSLGHAWPSQASKWAGLSQWCHGTALRNLGSPS